MALVFVRTIAQHTKDGFTFSHTHKTKKNELLRLQTPKTILKKPKGEKENQQEKIDINKIFKNHK